ncbi:hypothetical protein ABB37_07325 [Leptomonas pyrrhocoris]|uniref:Uncharacterized protein n=1 Tax=Leptomonas pyrrhocoris TaxID=157538 RepID=A0A0N1J4I3_LEPPY|nr:hypothetical protein ABB37_07325 [Leptomonas pyrrhocoris]KPA76951.1 hypothetical protein ABB37_07325 [Leptomonas pyrrhocoris]|eukprot:XP_015655390.1 hypothetical protein ABB37_07325 [Leptomonas pyrrhocoris]
MFCWRCLTVLWGPFLSPISVVALITAIWPLFFFLHTCVVLLSFTRSFAFSPHQPGSHQEILVKHPLPLPIVLRSWR